MVRQKTEAVKAPKLQRKDCTIVLSDLVANFEQLLTRNVRINVFFLFVFSLLLYHKKVFLSINKFVFFEKSCTLFQHMNHQVEVRKDLLKVISLMIFIGIILAGIKMYDAKTNEVGKVGEKLLKTYVN